MSDLQPLFDLLGGKFHRLPQLLGWLLALQTALKFINARLQKYLTAKVVESASDPDTIDDLIWRDILSARWYRIARFILDLVFRLKLPTLDDFENACRLAPPVPSRFAAVAPSEVAPLALRAEVPRSARDATPERAEVPRSARDATLVPSEVPRSARNATLVPSEAPRSARDATGERAADAGNPASSS